MEFWNKDMETIGSGRLESHTVTHLKATVGRALRAPFYRKLLGDSGLSEASVTRPTDIDKFPFIDKDDLRKHEPADFLSVPMKQVVRMHSSSGTTGRPVVVFHTKYDIDQWTDLLARCLFMTGFRDTDVFQNMMGYGLFTGGLGFHYGAERVGALVIPAGAGNSKRQIMLMKQYSTTAVHIIPSYALHLASIFAEEGVDPRRDTKLARAYVGAEPHSEESRKKIEEFYGVDAFNSYGLSEMCGPGVAFECPEKNGMHIWEDRYLVEVIDPKTLTAVEPGVEGELVLTTLDRQAMPIIRYRTRDRVRLLADPCPCGRTHRRISRITGRTDDMLIIKGVNIFPVQVERVLMRTDGVGNNFLIDLDTVDHIDRMTVRVEGDSALFAADGGAARALEKRIVADLKSELLITPRVTVVPAGTLPAGEGKAVRVVDSRPKQ
ncbi:MAG: phenylacetate--CoA ligase [Deltaproteobacteria bacterium]|nr:phenylacetate--CoA ligase [Candidatus Zymogenaceae bacterium]